MSKFIKKNISLILIIAAAILGIVLGLCSNILPSSFKDILSNGVFSAFQTVYVKIIGYIAGPLIFITIVKSIYDMNDFVTLGGRGRRYLLSYIAINLLVALLSVLITLPLMGISIDISANSSATLKEIGNLFKNFVPNNLWSPFINVSLIQIDLMAIIFGATLLALGEQAKWFKYILDKIGKFLMLLMRLVAKLIPIYIFVALANTLWNNNPSTLLSLWKLLGSMIILSLLACIILLIITSLYQKCSISKLFKNVIKVYLVGVTTANSAMGLPKQFEAGHNFGVSKREAQFSIPLGISFFKVSSTIYLAGCATYFYSLTYSSTGIVWIISASIMATILSFSVAPVPGGGINNGVVLFKELSINMAYLPIFIALDPLVDFIITGFNNFMQPLQNLNVASKNKEINKNILKDKQVILICGAMDVETDYLISKLDNKIEEALDEYKAFKGQVNQKDIIVLKTEIGSSNALKSTSLAINKYHPSELISIGTSGGHHTGVKRGDIIISKRIINYDMSGTPPLYPNKQYINKYLDIPNSQLGTILTSDTWHKTKQEITKIHEETGSDVEEMESYISCSLADERAIEYVAIRILSNNEMNDENYIRETGITLQEELLKIL